ncbi:MAG: hypothetical protein ACKOBL_05175, partial [Chloroflexota bacterium]
MPPACPVHAHPTEESLQPYLTGSATACDLTHPFINFTIAENAPARSRLVIRRSNAATTTPKTPQISTQNKKHFKGKPMKYISPRPMLALLLLIFANLACYVPSQIVKGDITCKHVAYNPLSGGHLYSCTCPLDTSNMTFSEIYAKDLNTITDQEVKNRACSNYSANTESNESQPTEAPTEEPGSTEPPADPAPLKPF